MAQTIVQQARTRPRDPTTTQPWHVAADQARRAAHLPDWPADRRAAALARLDEAGLPDSRQEDWRHTSLSAYQQRWASYLALAGPQGDQPELDRPALTHAGSAANVEIFDGVLRSVPANTPRGLTVCSLRHLSPERRAWALELLRQPGEIGPESLVDLNSALLTDVILIASAAGVAVEQPVHVRILGAGTPAFSQPRLLVDVAPGSRLTLIIEHAGAAGTLENAVTQAWVAPEGKLNLIRVQALPDDGMLTETTRIELAASASVDATSVDLGGQLVRQTLTVVLAGARASASIDGLFLANGQRHIDNQTRLEHRGPDTISRETFRGIADGHGHGIFNGKIIIEAGAAGSKAALTNRNLLLSATAEIDTKPELEIYVDDVRCSHGATTGQLDANALFYLRSRGLDPAAARQILIAAFLQAGLAGITVPELRARLEALLRTSLGTGLT